MPSNFTKTLGPIDLTSLYNPSSKDQHRTTLTRWQSKQSGLRVVHVDSEGPLVNLYSAIATEIFDDSGRPHTLEHLIFLGSEQYPYKGILDTLSNRAFADGTNAWTATNHTCYTISTAGQEGFLKLLPIYLDHVLYPTLTAEGFTTEVFHINGKGEEAGVVFSEMQGRENGSGDLMALAQQRALYPITNGLRSETGGLLSALRTLDNDQIRQYHGSTYLPHNLCVVVCGRVDQTRLLQVLDEHVEPSIAKHGQDQGPHPQGWQRPWVETTSAKDNGAPHFPKSDKAVQEVEFPEQDESVGEWQCTWSGPPNNDFERDAAIDLLGTYLTDSAIAPLTRKLVEIQDPYCTSLSFASAPALTNSITLYASGIPTEHLSELSHKIAEIMQDETKSFDLSRMLMLIDRGEAQMLSELEKSTAEAFSDMIINDFLHSREDGQDLQNALQDIKRFAAFRQWKAQQWIDLLNETFVKAASLVVIGKPSATLAERIEKESADVVEHNKAKFGKDGLSKLADKLKHAQEANDRPIPDEIIGGFKMPSTQSIEWIHVDSARSTSGWSQNAVQSHIDKDSAQLPFLIQFDHVSSEFLTVSLHLFANNMPHDLKRFLPLYLNSLFSLPVKQSDGTGLSFEQVVRRLDEETIEYGAAIGQSLFESVEIGIRVKKSNYGKAVSWLNDLLFNSVFDVERLHVTMAKSLQTLPSEKREGSDVATSALSKLATDEGRSLRHFNNLLIRNDNEPLVAQALSDDSKSIVDSLSQLRQHLIDTSRMRVSVTGDILSLAQPKSTWHSNFKHLKQEDLAAVPYGRDVLSKLGRKPEKKCLLYSLGSIEGSYASFSARGPEGWDHPDRPALIVTCGILNALESFLWRFIRGQGLAYGASIRDNAERSLITFSVYRSPDAAKAYKAAKALIDGLADGTHVIDQLLVDSAKGTLAYHTAAAEATRGMAAHASFVNQVLKGLSQQYNRDMLTKAADVTVEDCQRIIKTYLVPLFNSNHCIAGVASSKAKTDDIGQALREEGFDVQIETLESGNDDWMSLDDEESESGSQ